MRPIGRCLAAVALCISCAQAFAEDPQGMVDPAVEMQQMKAQLRALRTEVKSLSIRIAALEAKHKPARKSVKIDGAPSLGSQKAKVGIVEFADYQCPFCRRFQSQVFPLLKQNYIDSGKAFFAIREFPLAFHPQAEKAALAALCAGKQGPDKYWKVHSDLFQHQNHLGGGLYVRLVEKYGLDEKAYLSCVNDQRTKAEVTKSFEYGRSVGVKGTPTFFIGRRKDDRLVDAIAVEGAQSYSVIARIIDSFLGR